MVGTPRHNGSPGQWCFTLPQANRIESRLLGMPLPLHIVSELGTNVCRWSRHNNRWCLQRMDDLLSDILRFRGGFHKSPGGDTPAALVNCNQFQARLQFAIWAHLQLLGVGWNQIDAFGWNNITCARDRIMDLDSKIPWHMGGTLSGWFL